MTRPDLALAAYPHTPDGECRRCKWDGILFDDGGRRCFEHATNDDVRVIDELDKRAPGIGLRRERGGVGRWGKGYQWPYGPNINVPARRRLLEWAEGHELQLAKRGRRCLHWLRAGRCGVRTCLGDSVPFWQDHVTTWTREGRSAVFVAQPYQLSPNDTADLAVLDAEAGLRLELRAEGSWYGWGTWWIAVWRDGA